MLLISCCESCNPDVGSYNEFPELTKIYSGIPIPDEDCDPPNMSFMDYADAEA